MKGGEEEEKKEDFLGSDDDNDNGKMMMMEEEEEDDWYALLNVSSDCTLEDIQKSYKQLSRTFHPDKLVQLQQQKNTTSLELGQEIFLKFKQAYDILSDPVLRQAYDLYGHNGVAFILHHIKQQQQQPQPPTNNNNNNNDDDNDSTNDATQDDDDNTGSNPNNKKEGLYDELKQWHTANRPDISSFLLQEAMAMHHHPSNNPSSSSSSLSRKKQQQQQQQQQQREGGGGVQVQCQSEMKCTAAMPDRMLMEDAVMMEMDQMTLGSQFSFSAAENGTTTGSLGGNIRMDHHTQQTNGQLSCGIKLTPVTNTELSCDVSIATSTTTDNNNNDPSITLQSTRVGTHQTISMAGLTLQPSSQKLTQKQSSLFFHVGNLFVSSHRNLWDNQFRATWSTAFSPTTFQFHYALLSFTTLSNFSKTKHKTQHHKSTKSKSKQSTTNNNNLDIRYTLKFNLGLDPYPLKLVAFTAPPSSSSNYHHQQQYRRRLKNKPLLDNWQCSVATNMMTGFQWNGMVFSKLTPFLSMGMGLSHDTAKGLYSILRFNSTKHSHFSFQIPIHLASPSLLYLLGGGSTTTNSSISQPNLYDSSFFTTAYYTLLTLGLHQLLDQLQTLIASFHPREIPLPPTTTTSTTDDTPNTKSLFQNIHLQYQNMTPTAQRKMMGEENKLHQSKQGLVILHATYEWNTTTTTTTTTTSSPLQKSQNVTIPLQFWVHTPTSTLHIPSSLIQLHVLPGFGSDNDIPPTMMVNPNNTSNTFWMASTITTTTTNMMNALSTNIHSTFSNAWNWFWYGPHAPVRTYLPLNCSSSSSQTTNTLLLVRYKTLEGVFEITIHNNHQDLILPHPQAMKLGNLESVH